MTRRPSSVMVERDRTVAIAILRTRQIVTNRKEGNQVFYSLRYPAFTQILDILRGCFEANLREAIQMLGEIESESRTK